MIEIAVRGSDVPALVDDQWADLTRYTWKLRNGYAIRSAKGEKIAMHHVVMGATPSFGMVRDHINRNRLDNREVNLRWVTRAENNRNRNAAAKNRTGFRGVRFCQAKGQYLATIQTGGKAVFRKWYDDPVAANDDLVALRPSIFPTSTEAA